jgi:hypothetical protein
MELYNIAEWVEKEEYAPRRQFREAVHVILSAVSDLGHFRNQMLLTLIVSNQSSTTNLCWHLKNSITDWPAKCNLPR